MPLEVVFSVAAGLSIVQLFRLGYRWDEIQTSIVRKLARALPAMFILFAIGVIISSWMLSGTIPMLVYYGLKIIDPSYIYLIAFIVPVVFSTLTGTSWGSVGTVGVVLIGVAKALEADMGIAAGAIIGGAYFGDKLSPLSDTCQGRSKFGPLRRSKSRPVGEGVAVFVGRLERSLRSPFRAAQA